MAIIFCCHHWDTVECYFRRGFDLKNFSELMQKSTFESYAQPKAIDLPKVGRGHATLVHPV